MLLLLTFAVLPPARAHGWLSMHSMLQCGVELTAWLQILPRLSFTCTPDLILWWSLKGHGNQLLDTNQWSHRQV